MGEYHRTVLTLLWEKGVEECEPGVRWRGERTGSWKDNEVPGLIQIRGVDVERPGLYRACRGIKSALNSIVLYLPS